MKMTTNDQTFLRKAAVLTTAERETQAALKQEVHRLQVLGQIKQAVLVDQSPRRFAETAFAYFRDIVSFDHASVVLFDLEKGRGEILAVMGVEQAGLSPGDTIPLDECFPNLDLLRDPSKWNSNLLQPQPFLLMEKCLSNTEFNSCLSLLLVSHNEVIGSLNIGSRQVKAFDETAIRLARDVADSLAVAIQKAMLFEKTRLKAAELEALSKLSFRLRQAETWGAMVRIIREEAEQALNADISIIFWYKNEVLHVISGGLDNEKTIAWKRADLPQSPIWAILDSGQPLFAGFPLAELANIVPVSYQLRSSVFLPLRTGNRQLGNLCLGFRDFQEFSTEEQRLLSSIADIAGNALYRAYVMETLEERVANRTRQLVTLYNISKTINQTLDLPKMLEQSMTFLQQASNADVFIHLYDDNNQGVIFRGPERLLDVQEEEIEPLVEAVAQSGDLIQTKIQKTNPTLSSLEASLYYLGFPLKGRYHLLGVLSLLTTQHDRLGEDDLSLFSGVADHISIALENAKLRKQAEAALVIEERQRMARELHDSISQLLYSQLLFAEASQRAWELKEMDMLPRYLNRLNEVAEQAFKEMRLLIYSLRPQMLESEGLVGALQHRLHTVEKRTGLDVNLEACEGLKLPAPMEDALFRIAQEALNNVLKHAAATAVTVQLQRKDGMVSLTVSDNGRGFIHAEAIEGIGLSSMQERARQLGGTLIIASQPQQGTTISALVPYTTDEKKKEEGEKWTLKSAF
jgi:signal transduction histidine kinase